MGPIEASIRERAISARRRLMAEGGSMQAIQSLAMLAANPRKIVRRIHIKPRVFAAGEHLSVTDTSVMPATPSTSTDQIIDEVCAKYKVARKDMLSAIRSQFIMPARFEAIYRIRDEKCLSWAQIGRIFNRDHTSCLHAWRRHKGTLEACK